MFATAIALASAASRTNATTAPPHVLLIVADDLGFGDLGYTGSDIKTPHIDGLATGGAEDTGIGDLRTAKSRLGIAYALTEQGEDSLVGAERTAELVEVEVYYAPEIAALYATN